ncbi:unnamed protein product [Chrysodeixis includens]|uniref:Kazal-like domain-containing protein n=1 Tax=Chrysodeixis includens TaxID=689277 RepID=A0A9P0FTT4_CHRIL|nr:unnamed protein product [Chrysodeixis includens]
MMLKGETLLHKLWYFLSTYVLTLKRFDLFLQGSLLIVILLETNAYLLLKRDATEGYHPALVEDYVLLGAAGLEFLLAAAVAWWGRGRRNLALSGWLAVTSAAGLLVLAFPHANVNPIDVELCGGDKVSNFFSSQIVDNNQPARTAFLVLTVMLCALAKVSIWSHGFTYLDDHDPQNGPYFYGILISIRLSLGLSGHNWLRPGSVREDWWKAHLSLCMLTFMFSVLFTLFPRRMPNCVTEETVQTDSGLFSSLGRLVRNRALVLQTLAIATLSAGVFGFVHYDRDYVQARFHIEAIRQDPRTSRTVTDIFRSLVIIFFVMIFRVRFSAQRIDGVKSNTASRVAGVVAIFVAVFFTVLTVVGCDVGEIQGLQTGEFVQPSCSQACGCTSQRYGFSPVCELESRTTFFSPCNAGCTSAEDLNGVLLYGGCACGAGSRAVRGACSLTSCRLAFAAYQILYTVMLAVSASCFLMLGMAVVRSVRAADKALAVGASSALVALLGFGLGHLVYMLISYLTCMYWSGGACALHYPSLWAAGATSAALAAVTSLFSLAASKAPSDRQEPPTTEL